MSLALNEEERMLKDAAHAFFQEKLPVKALRALRDAGLVSERKDGRHIHYRVRREGFEPLVNWLDRWSIFWNERFDNLERLLEQQSKSGNSSAGERSD